MCQSPSDYGRASLKALRRGELPPNLDFWPDEPPKEVMAKRKSETVSLQVDKPKAAKIYPVPLGNAFASTLSQDPISSIRDFSMPPTVAETLAELLALYEAGESVEWPNGYNPELARRFIAFDSGQESSEFVHSHVITSVVESEAGDSNVVNTTSQQGLDHAILQDLLDLHDVGEQVSWPSGLSAPLARSIVLGVPHGVPDSTVRT